jgi:DNA invertase Pin-like site-specific DNA recombinase
MIYAYLRVSSTDQNLARQIEAIKGYVRDISDGAMFSDKQSGKNFDRPEYKRLKSVLTSGDEVIVKELDRLGRDKNAVKEELKWFKDNGVIVRILDVPSTLIDFQGQDWIADMVNNIIIEVLAAMAEQERIKIQKRREEGINAMPVVDGKKVSSKTGRRTGRPTKAIEDFDVYVQRVKDGMLSVSDAVKTIGISRTQWYRLIKEES